MTSDPDSFRPDRTVWHAAMTGGTIALVLTVLGIVAFFTVDSSPAPSGYAGAAYGRFLAYVIGAALVAALLIGLLVGGILYRRRRSWIFMWGVMLVLLGGFFTWIWWLFSTG
ncbi:hypothetical protein KY495_11685 [Massilia sp. PAMC28688]|uniref:hypothetical protein n=1 Tax=Massilia sp. PAMC28688 TaxID=2861283 RepID=UPI001C638502|nr:hypothetical protein [Massilia sp. PAMC28688]QYF95751.1 hypothetical protein KY495_11685 [Massilia sp. PAMC28688]